MKGVPQMFLCRAEGIFYPRLENMGSALDFFKNFSHIKRADLLSADMPVITGEHM